MRSKPKILSKSRQLICITMSLFDADLVTQCPMADDGYDRLKENTFLGMWMLKPTFPADIYWLNDLGEFKRLVDFCVREKKPQSIWGHLTVGSLTTICEIAPDGDFMVLPPVLEEHKGRSFISLDCSKLKKGDAKGFLDSLFQLGPDEKPVVVIYNITEIPRVGSNIDDPELVENLLLHSWKDRKPENSTVLIPILKQHENKINLTHLKNDGYGHVQQFEEDLRTWMETEFLDEMPFLVKRGWLTKVQHTAVRTYIEEKNHKETKAEQ